MGAGQGAGTEVVGSGGEAPVRGGAARGRGRGQGASGKVPLSRNPCRRCLGPRGGRAVGWELETPSEARAEGGAPPDRPALPAGRKGEVSAPASAPGCPAGRRGAQAPSLAESALGWGAEGKGGPRAGAGLKTCRVSACCPQRSSSDPRSATHKNDCPTLTGSLQGEDPRSTEVYRTPPA